MKNKLFFSGLNEIRAFAAFAVLFHHIELYKNRINLKSIFDIDFFNYFISNLGQNGVFLFFVLSGFLITYLLLEEKQVNNSISVKKFYTRRILRIWPLYFIIVIIGFAFLPLVYNSFPDFFSSQKYYNEKIENIVYGKNLMLFLFFFSNVAMRIFSPVAGASQSWSVSVEEQFYFIWPWIVKFFSKNLYFVLTIIIVVINLILYKINSFNNYPIFKIFISSFHIDFMAIGGISAVFYRSNIQLVERFYNNKSIGVLIFISLLIHLFYKVSNLTLSITFVLLIILFIEKKVKIKLFNQLGKWSYGIYMYHPVVMYFSFAAVHKLNLNSFVYNNILYYILIISLTVLISFLSYKYIELFFLKVKHKFSPIVSGNI